MKLTYKYVSLSGIDQCFTECWYVFYFREKSYENNFSRFYSLMNLFFLDIFCNDYVFSKLWFFFNRIFPKLDIMWGYV